ncbi:helix-turn-helix domain-containing protein [Kordia zhangzhouensis]|uniref:helix-turn-helix domain-containing protein n=1 Tax=Kordia zhangzhouensis TaxID=1620405 RepID=UPI000629C481|nr:helix-turn-helix domain-containing protein [Kordia zhangzhouensis]
MSLDALYTEISELKKLIQNLGIQQKEYLNTEEASTFLGISKSTFYKITSACSIPKYKPNGKMMLFKKSDLLQFIENGRINSEQDLNEIADKLTDDLLNDLLK